MIFYISGDGHGEVRDKMLDLGVAKLCSFAYPKACPQYLTAADERGQRVRMMIDSGAFTVWNAGGEVELQALIAYVESMVEAYGERHDIVCIALDKIPGAKGAPPTPDDIERAVETSVSNYHKMRQVLPVPVIPVYHTGEAQWVLDEYRKHTDYVAFGMSQDWSNRARLNWAMANQKPGLKIHGLAATSTEMLVGVDWYSVDSATWAMAAAMGHLVMETARGIRQISISSESTRLKIDSKHIDNMPEREAIYELIRSKGYDVEQLRIDSKQRQLFNLEAFATYRPEKRPVIVQELF